MPTPKAVKLSVRERQIVDGMFNGKTNAEIAASLKISEHTVRLHMTILLQKLNGGPPPDWR